MLFETENEAFFFSILRLISISDKNSISNLNTLSMKHLFTFLLTCIGVASAWAQAPAADQIQTTKGILTIQPIFHGALVLTLNKKTIYVDPYGGGKAFKGMPSPDLILITDVHPDHLDTATLNAIQTSKAKFIVPQAVADLLPAKYKKKAIVLANGKETKQAGITVSAVPMYNLPEEADSKHPKGRGNGYLVKMAEKTIYISGDTEDTPEMRKLKNVDIAFLCMNLPYTMDIDQAASAVLEFKPSIVYPYHYRGQNGLSDTDGFKKLVEEGDKAIDVRLRNWYVSY